MKVRAGYMLYGTVDLEIDEPSYETVLDALYALSDEELVAGIKREVGEIAGDAIRPYVIEILPDKVPDKVGNVTTSKSSSSVIKYFCSLLGRIKLIVFFKKWKYGRVA